MLRAGIFSIFILLAASAVYAQQPNPFAVPPKLKDSVRHMIIREVMGRIEKGHYAPKQVDDSFSLHIWESYLGKLDPYRLVFEQRDIDKLTSFRYNIDEQLASAQTPFFDAVFRIYQQRLLAFSQYGSKLLRNSFDPSSPDSFIVKDQSTWPASDSEKQKRWGRFLQYKFLQQYAAAGGQGAEKPEPALEQKAMAKTLRWLDQYCKPYIEDKFAEYLNTIVQEMDPHSKYTGPNDLYKVWGTMMGKLYGLPLDLAIENSEVYLRSATMAGAGLLMQNDRIIAVADADGNLISTDGRSASETLLMMAGLQGTKVRLIVQQPGKAERTVDIERQEVTLGGLQPKSAIVELDGKKIGYILLPYFFVNPQDIKQPGSSAFVAEEIKQLNKAGVQAIIVDLRGNPGGALHEVVWMAGSFMTEGPVSLLRSRDSIAVHSIASGTQPLFDGPLAVMVDESSASSSEIFAALVQDRGRGLVIGTASTYGKGTAQNSWKMGRMASAYSGLPDLSFGGLGLTRQKFYRINGNATQLKGVIPDIVLLNRTDLDKVTEKDYPAALKWDTIAVPGYQPGKRNFNYTAVTQQAKDRISKNTSFQSIPEILASIRQLEQQPVPLNFAGYFKRQQELQHLKTTLQKARELSAGNELKVEAAKEMQAGAQAEAFNKWLNRLSLDQQLAEAARVVEDMMKYQLP